MNDLLLDIDNKTGSSLAGGWSVAVPGVAVNYTSQQMAARMKNPNVQKTGKGNTKNVAAYVRYNNMTTQWVCVAPLESTNSTGQIGYFEKGKEFPSCPLYEYEWPSNVSSSMGYRLAFATDYANRIGGCDGNMFGRPLTSSKVQMYVNDIYRTLYLFHAKDVRDWHQGNFLLIYI